MDYPKLISHWDGLIPTAFKSTGSLFHVKVAITIFWLGKYASKNYHGPQLDLSAFAAFVHLRQNTDTVEREYQAPVLSSSHWDWSHGSQGRPAANSSSVDLSFHHTRDSSYDSFEKESFESLDEPDSKMPMTRYSSASALNKTRDSLNFHTFDSSYSNDRNSSLYRSSPDLANSSYHRRYSSTDSMDGSHNSGHSRQGSDALESNYATRRLSSQSNRKSSSSADPLQFVKLKGANDLAYTAEVQMRVAAESKLGASISRAKDDDADWQSDLSSWKNRRKSQSERTYHLQQELEQKEEINPTSAPKTYSQMQEDRERRRSSGRSFYPIEDENDDDDAFTPETKLVSSSSSSFTQAIPKDGVAAWAKDSDDENQNVKHNITKTNGVNSDDQNDKNNNFSDSIKAEENSNVSSKSSRSRLTDKLRAFDEDDNDTFYTKISDQDHRVPKFKGDSDNKIVGKNSINLTQSKAEDKGFSSEISSKWTKDTNGDVTTKKDNDASNKKSESYGKAKEMFSRSDSVSDRDNNSYQKITTVHNVGSRTQNKIGSIMKNFTDSENKVLEPKQGYNEKIDLSARKSAFQKDTSEYKPTPAPVPARRNFGSFPSKEESDGSSYESEGDEDEEDGRRHEDSLDSNKEPSPSSYPPIPTSNPPSVPQKPVAAVAPAIVSAPPVKADYNSKKNLLEKTIIISQKANNDKGFGFFLTGGIDNDAPITVSKVTLGSSADLCELKVKDTILSINHMDVSEKSTSEVGDIVGRAVSAGYIELRISRETNEDDFDDEEDFSSSEDEGQSNSNRQSAGEIYMNIDMNSNTSVMHQLAAEKAWLEQQIEDTERREAENRKPQKFSYEPVHTDQSNKVEVETRLTLSLDRSQDSLDDLSPSSFNTRPSPSSSQILEDDSDGSGPPAILRKWQRQRHKEEYTFDPVSDASETFKRISLNASLPRRNSNEDKKDFDRYRLPETNGTSSESWEKRIEDWTQQQDKKRQYVNSFDVTDQAKINEENKKLQEKYEEDLRKVEERKVEKRKEEDEAFISRAETAKMLEERRAERRARIQQTAAEAAGTSVQREQPESHTTSVTLSINKQQQPEYENMSFSHPKPFVPYSPPSSTLIIDPRNQQRQSENSIQFQMKIGSQPSADKETAQLLEAERERIRIEEMKKIEEERRRLEEEQKAKEREKLQAIREKEEEVRREKEKLELERQKFLKEQEEFKKLKEQQEQFLQKQQQEQLLLKQQQEQLFLKQQQEQLLLKQQQEQLQNQQEQLYSNRQEEPRLRKQQQDSYNSAPKLQPVAAKCQSASPSLRDKSSSSYNTSFTSSSPPKFTNSSQPTVSRNSYTLNTVNANHHPPPKQNAIPTSRLSRNLEGSSGDESDPSQAGHRFSREQMLAMNRRAKPMQALPSESNSQEATPKEEEVSSVTPITREAPSRVELHSLNSVPKAKFRDPSEIYVNVGTTNPALSPRHTEPNKRFTAPWMDNSDDKKRHTFSAFGEHWLIEEAERRRLAESSSKLPTTKTSVHSSNFSGPIKPANDNRWRGDTSMPQAIRQTLLQKTSGLRGSTPDLAFSSNTSYSSSRSSSLPPNESMTSQHNLSSSPKEYQQNYASQYNQQQPKSRYSQPDQGRAPVNGKQPCSHCNEEIGFGTAMVIEALGLFYHVQCFRCCVCHTSLGSGQHGADVRVRGSKLHCPNCYSNDEGVRKSSQAYHGRLIWIKVQ
nr:calponin homology domain-containing protein [Biomphalaria glabrata]